MEVDGIRIACGATLIAVIFTVPYIRTHCSLTTGHHRHWLGRANAYTCVKTRDAEGRLLSHTDTLRQRTTWYYNEAEQRQSTMPSTSASPPPARTGIGSVG
ncbi:hypothetical protein D3C76_791100 [compost metagenome]